MVSLRAHARVRSRAAALPPLSRFALALAVLALLPSCKRSSSPTATSTLVTASGGPKAPISTSVNVEANEKGFSPSSFDLTKGYPATLIFRRTSNATCATEVVFPDLKITKPLPYMVPVPIDVPTGDARTLVFQCGMGMFKGKAIIH
jgi:plastocyanin domain-containing protein